MYVLPLGTWADGLEFAVLIAAVVLTLFTGVQYAAFALAPPRVLAREGRRMRAEIVGVGTEILLGQIANDNARYISERLAEVGVDVLYHTAVGDNLDRIAGRLPGGARAGGRPDRHRRPGAHAGRHHAGGARAGARHPAGARTGHRDLPARTVRVARPRVPRVEPPAGGRSRGRAVRAPERGDRAGAGAADGRREVRLPDGRRPVGDAGDDGTDGAPRAPGAVGVRHRLAHPQGVGHLRVADGRAARRRVPRLHESLARIPRRRGRGEAARDREGARRPPRPRR